MHWGVIGLVFQGQLIHMVASDAQREDGEGEEVAPVVGAAEYTSQVVRPILYRMTHQGWHMSLLYTDDTGISEQVS